METQVFISYAHEDYLFAKELFNDLKERRGIIPWLDKENLLPGMDWEHEVMQALKESRFFIPLISNNSVNKTGFVQREIKESLKRLASFPAGAIFIIPARLDESEPKDQELLKLHWMDMFPDWHAGVRQIVATIDHERSKTIQRPIESLLAISASIGRETPPLWNRMSRTMVMDQIKSRKSLSGANLMEANLCNVDFSDCDLRGANLVAADLTGAILSRSQLAGANCERSQLIAAKIDHANLWGVNLWHAQVLGIEGWNEIDSLEQANFYKVSGVSEDLQSMIRRFKINYLPDYGSFFDYFRSDMGMSPKEIKSTFIWVNHEYFRSLLESVEEK